MTAPGVGPITAIAFAAAVEDPTRLRRAGDVGAHLELTPTQRQSGEVALGGRLAKRGDRLSRRLLFEAARVIVHRTRAPLGLRDWAARLTGRVGGRKARVALARELATILFRMMQDGRNFETRSSAA